MNLSTFLKDRNNGITQSRVVLALFVLLDHQYTLLQIPKPRLLSGPLTLSSFAVYMFIFMSGLLCFISRSRNTAPRFILLRFARIFPGYVACLAISSLLFIPLLAWLSAKTSFLSLELCQSTIKAAAEYFFGNLSFTQNVYLPASLKISLPIPAINGSLWTLQPEIMGYFLIAILFPLFCLTPRFLVILLSAGVICLSLLPVQLRAGLPSYIKWVWI